MVHHTSEKGCLAHAHRDEGLGGVDGFLSFCPATSNKIAMASRHFSACEPPRRW